MVEGYTSSKIIKTFLEQSGDSFTRTLKNQWHFYFTCRFAKRYLNNYFPMKVLLQESVKKNSIRASEVKTEAVVRRCSVKKVLLEISQNSQENNCAGDSFLTKPQACNFIKKDSLVQVFSCAFCKISKNTFFCRIPLVAASVNTSN